jgi:hypothetical protein
VLSSVIIEVPNGDSLLTFIRDADDILFEIKETKRAQEASPPAAPLPDHEEQVTIPFRRAPCTR